MEVSPSKEQDIERPKMTEIFMPREHWIPDSQSNKCYGCEAKFHFFNRRHHCRMCGNLYDKKCANCYVKPPKFLYEAEKKIRLCKTCFEQAQAFQKQARTGNAGRGLTLTNQLPLSLILKLEKFMDTSLTQRVHDQSDQVLQHIFSMNDVPSRWFDLLSKIAKQSVELVQPSTMRYDHININTYIKVKKILYKDNSLTKLIKGVVIRKNITHNKMAKEIQVPSILMIRGNLEVSSKDELMIFDANNLNQERDYLQAITKKIIKLDPKILIVEGSVHGYAQEALLDKNITLIMNMKEAQFSTIARFTKSKPIEDLDKLDIATSKVLGSCQHFFVKNFENKGFYENLQKYRSKYTIWENFDPSIMYLDGCNPEKGVTVLISGPDQDELNKIKKCLKLSFRILRNLVLEKTMIYQEIFMYHTKERLYKRIMQSNDSEEEKEYNFRDKLEVQSFVSELEENQEIITSSCLLNDITASTAGYLLNFLTEKDSIDSVIKRRTITFTKLILVPLEFASYPDLASVNEAIIRARLEDHLKGNKHRFHRDQLCQIGGDPKVMRIHYYEKEDMSLGNYLFHKSSRITEKCLESNRYYYYHTTLFFCKKVFIKVSLELKDGPRLQQIRKETKKNTTIMHDNVRDVKKRMNDEVSPNGQRKHKDGFFDFLANVTPLAKKEALQQQQQKMASLNSTVGYSGGQRNTTLMSKLNQLGVQPTEVMMFIECSTCKYKLSESIKVRKGLLEYSFARYLENLVSNSSCYLDVLYNIWDFDKHEFGFHKSLDLLRTLPRRANIRPCCPISPKNRVFLIGDLQVRFTIGCSCPYSFEFLDYNLPKSQEIVKKHYETINTQKKNKLIEYENQYLSMINCSLKVIVEDLLDRTGLSITMENLEQVEGILNQNNPMSKEPYNRLLLGLIPILRTIENHRSLVQKLNEKEFKSNIAIDEERKRFFEQMIAMSEMLEKIKFEYEKAQIEKGSLIKQKDSSNSKSKDSSKLTISQQSRIKDISTDEIPEFELDQLTDSRRYTPTPAPKKLNGAHISRSRDNFESYEKEAANNNIVVQEEESKVSVEKEADIEKRIMNGLIEGISYYSPVPDFEQYQKFRYYPIYEDQPLGVIGFTLNSPSYMRDVYVPENFHKYEQNTSSPKPLPNDMEWLGFLSKLLSINEERRFMKQFSMKIPSAVVEKKYFNSILNTLNDKRGDPLLNSSRRRSSHHDFSEEQQQQPSGYQDSRHEKSFISLQDNHTTVKYQCTVYYPVQFEALRSLNKISLESYLKSLSASNSWADNTGGKTNAKFIKTADQRFVIKTVDKKEFQMFLDYIHEYFKFMTNIDKPSLLTKIYGIYEVQIEKNSPVCLVAMENLFFGMGSNLKVYDLKGSVSSRYVSKGKFDGSKTLLDTDYKLDRNGEPLPIKSTHMEYIEKAIKTDTQLLASVKVIDYSMLVIIDEDNFLTRMGIIDYLRIFDFGKQFESLGKKILKGTTPTVTEPEDYKERFQRSMSRYFMGVATEEEMVYTQQLSVNQSHSTSRIQM